MSYLDRTPEDHPDYKLLSEALANIKTVARHIDDSKLESENAKRMLKIQNMVGNKFRIILPHRKLIYDGHLKVKWIRTGSNNRLINSHVYLFNDSVLITVSRPNRKHTQLKDSEIVAFVDLKDMLGLTVLPPETAPELKYGMKISFNDGDVIHMYTTDEPKRKKWVHHFLTNMNDAVKTHDTWNKNSSLRQKRKEALTHKRSQSYSAPPNKTQTSSE
eukprot:TRINITY_DN9414_c0_g2_i1.p1 TRINITY_DN9414_c0_g2~~TRINITY_DN9414_c0_g2_i1.p1  ORF type:complete len:217 (-),score=33.67 TRINITY_DN9414_c0_g2_i1:9-659(-)